MKPRKFDRKLILNKITISNLENGEMKNVYGGCKTEPIGSCGAATNFRTCTCDPTFFPHNPCCY